MRKHFNIFIITLFAIAINSCKKYESISNPDPIVPYEAGTVITIAVAGKVTAQDGTALNGVVITIGSSTTITDIGGNFIIPQATINQNAGCIKATKEGYFAGSRTIIAKEKVINNIVIQLVKKTETGSFVNANGGTITVASGGSIVFPANAIALKNGAAYTGTVKVAANFLDPTSKNCYKEMPGDLRGINTANNEQVLTSYGMMVVELQGSNGEALQIAAGKTATLTMPINATIQSTAPITIPLWYFDETKAMWIEQGTANKTGNNYVGSVSHFTWWNCDWGGGPLQLTAKFVDQNGNPLSNYHVYYTTNAGFGGGGGGGITGSDGSLTGKIPDNTPIIIKVYDNHICNGISETIYSKIIESVTQNTDAGTLVVTIPDLLSRNIELHGNVINCNNNPVVNGYATIGFGQDKYYTTIVNGVLNFNKTFCNSVLNELADIKIYDMDGLKENSVPVKLNITKFGTFDLGLIAACGQGVDQFLNCTYDSTNYFFNQLNAYQDNNKTYLTGYISNTPCVKFELHFNGISAGIYSTLWGTSVNDFWFANQCGLSYGTSSNASLTIYEYGSVGEYITGRFSGTIPGRLLATYPIISTFRIKRTQ